MAAARFLLGDVLFGFSEREDAAANPSRRIAPSYAQSRFGQNRSLRGCSRAKVLLQLYPELVLLQLYPEFLSLRGGVGQVWDCSG